jgi:apolipoprotein N-acyltransferase
MTSEESIGSRERASSSGTSRLVVIWSRPPRIQRPCIAQHCARVRGERIGRLTYICGALVLPILGGAELAFAFPTYNHCDVVWVGLVPVAIAVAMPLQVTSYIGAYLGGLTFALLGLDWVRTSNRGPWTPAWLVMSSVLAMTWLLVMAVGRICRHRFRWSVAVSFALAWGVGVVVFQGFSQFASQSECPWLDVAATQVDRAWLIQIADLGGSLIVTMFIAYVNGVWCDLVVSKDGFRQLAKATVLTLLIAAYGNWRLKESTTSDTLTVCLMPHDSLPTMANQVKSPTLKSDLLIWSEALFHTDDELDKDTIRLLELNATHVGTALLSGWDRGKSPARHNSIVFVDPTKGFQGVYDKTCLVPLCEFTPWFGTFLPKSARPYLREYQQGSKWPLFRAGNIQVGPAICFDACSPYLMRKYRTADVLVVCGSEAIDGTSALRQSMLQVVRLRAVELRRTIVRNVADGFSGAVSSTGELLHNIEDTGARGPLRLEHLPIDRRFSLYALGGPLSTAAVLIMVGIVHFALHALKHRLRGFRPQSSPLA